MTRYEATDVVLEDDAERRLFQPNQSVVVNDDTELQNADPPVLDLGVPEFFPPSPEWPGTGNSPFTPNFGTPSSLPVPLSSTASSISTSLSNTSSLARWQRLPREERRSNPYSRSRGSRAVTCPDRPHWQMQNKSNSSRVDSYHLEDSSCDRSWCQEDSRDLLVRREP